MIPTIPQSRLIRATYGAYVALFFIYLALPLAVVAIFAFNDSQFPSLPWEGFTWDWFFGDERPKIGVFHERPILRAIGTSAFVGLCVSLLSVAVGTSNAFLFNRYDFRGKGVFYVLMLLPLVVIAGWLADVAFWIMIAALVVTVVTGVDYLISALRLRRESAES